MGLQKFIEKVLLPKLRKHYLSLWFLPVVSGIALIFGYPPFEVPGLPFVALVPLFFFLSLFGSNRKRCFLAGLITGFIFFAFVMSWGFSLFPSGTGDVGLEILNAVGILLLWLTLSVLLAVFVGLFSLGYSCLVKGRIWDVLLIPSLWIVADYLRVWGFGLFIAGPESLWGSHWTLGSLAYGLAQNQGFRSLASIGGTYLVSFLIVLVNYLFFYFLRDWSKNKGRGRVAILLMLFLISASYLYSLPSSENGDGQSIRIASVQTKFPSSLFLSQTALGEKFQIQKELLARALHYPYKVDVILFPEDSRFLAEINEVNLGEFFEGEDVLVIDSADEKGGKFIGSFFSPQDGILARYEKMLLIPYSNYLPYTFEFVVKVVSEDWLREARKFKDMKKGEEAAVPDIPGYGKIGLLFCSEAISPVLHRQIAEGGGQIFLNAGSLAFARGSRIIDSQTLAMLQFRAAENNRYVVRATNYGRSYFIDHRGNVLKITANFGSGVLFGQARLISPKTLYTRYGDLILGLAFLVIFLYLLTARNRPLPIDKKR